MQLSNEALELIKKIEQGEIDFSKDRLNNTKFGVFIPTKVVENTVVKMQPNENQTESDLKISITKDMGAMPHNSKQVGWFGNVIGKDSICEHPGGRNCRHCTDDHGAPTRNCNAHYQVNNGVDVTTIFPELDYDRALEEFKNEREELLNKLAEEGFGVSLLHAHSPNYQFTELPSGYVAVVSDAKTFFRSESEVEEDETFVPNTWRFVNGELKVAGGFSEK